MVVRPILLICANTISLLQNTAIDRCVLNQRLRIVHFRRASNSIFTKSNRPNVLKSFDNMLVSG